MYKMTIEEFIDSMECSNTEQSQKQIAISAFRIAEAAEQIAFATERMANSAKRKADATERIADLLSSMVSFRK